MENVRNWAAMLSLTAVICTLFEIFVPPGRVGKSMNMVISLFAVCLAVFPLISAFAAVRLLVFSAFDPITSQARRASRPLLHV